MCVLIEEVVFCIQVCDVDGWVCVFGCVGCVQCALGHGCGVCSEGTVSHHQSGEAPPIVFHCGECLLEMGPRQFALQH